MSFKQCFFESSFQTACLPPFKYSLLRLSSPFHLKRCLNLWHMIKVSKISGVGVNVLNSSPRGVVFIDYYLQVFFTGIFTMNVCYWLFQLLYLKLFVKEEIKNINCYSVKMIWKCYSKSVNHPFVSNKLMLYFGTPLY